MYMYCINIRIEIKQSTVYVFILLTTIMDL